MSGDNKKFFKFIILSQCFGQLAILAFDNGLMFNYFGSFTKSDSTLIVLLKMPSIASLILVLPLAYFADLYGKKILGQSGNLLQVIGLGVVASGVYAENRITLLFIGVIIFSIGSALFRCSWFALLEPLISREERGHFFARMRTAWKVCGILFTFLVQYLLGVKGTDILFQLIILLMGCSLIQMVFYQKIPELEKPEKGRKSSFFKETGELLRDKLFVKFTLFKFIFPLMVGSIALLFNIYEKKYLSFKPADIMLMGNCLFIGGIVGLWLGAICMKKYQERTIFLITTSMITILVVLFPLSSQFTGSSALSFAGSITFALGCCVTALGIAETSLMLSLLQPERKSLASSMCITCSQLGVASSGLLIAYILKNSAGSSGGGYNNVHALILICSVILLPFLQFFLTAKLKHQNS